MTAPNFDPPFESARPPRWAETLLRVLLPTEDAETVFGDLLEEYREAVRPSRGRGRQNDSERPQKGTS